MSEGKPDKEVVRASRDFLMGRDTVSPPILFTGQIGDVLYAGEFRFTRPDWKTAVSIEVYKAEIMRKWNAELQVNEPIPVADSAVLYAEAIAALHYVIPSDPGFKPLPDHAPDWWDLELLKGTEGRQVVVGVYAGKGQSVLGMLRTLWDIFRPGDVMLAERLMCTWTEMVMLKERGVDCVCRLTSHRTADFRRGKRLGTGDHVVKWLKPTKPRSIDRKTYDSLPDFLMIRETRVRVEQPGFRIQSITVATTLLDAEEFTQNDLAQLYRARWNAELDLRSLKQTMQMDILRCKTPELVRKEIWTHILAYNLIRTIIAQAAVKHGVEPRSISFKGAIQTLEAFQPLIAIQGQCDSAFRRNLYQQLLDAIATHRVADRPDRFEPRRRKRRPKPYDRLMKPRHEAKRDILNGFSEN